MNDKLIGQKYKRKYVGFALLPLVFLPGLLLLCFIKLFLYSSWIDVSWMKWAYRHPAEWSDTFIVINALSSFGIAFGVIRSFLKIGIMRVIATIILGVVLSYVSYYTTSFLILCIFGMV